MNRRIGLATAALALALALPSGVLAGPAVGSQFAGLWVSTDPVDGSTQMLKIAAGSAPSVTYQDFFASSCEDHGSPSTHWVAAGRGEVDGNFLGITFHKSGCGAFTIGAYEDYVEYDAGTDTLIDSSGTTYDRA
jgi:hypothetical protein